MKIFAESFGVNKKDTIFASQFQKATQGKAFPTARRKALTSFRAPALQAGVRQNEKINRAFSSAGSEHLPYKQGVGGSNPSTPTIKIKHLSIYFGECFFYIQYDILLSGIILTGLVKPDGDISQSSKRILL